MMRGAWVIVVVAIAGGTWAEEDVEPRTVLAVDEELDCREQRSLEMPAWFDATKSWRMTLQVRAAANPTSGSILCWGDGRAGLDPICLKAGPRSIAGWVQDNTRGNRDVCYFDSSPVSWSDQTWTSVSIEHDAQARKMIVIVNGRRAEFALVSPPRPDVPAPLWLGGIGMTIHRFPCWIRSLRLEQCPLTPVRGTATARLLRIYNAAHGLAGTHGTLKANVTLRRAGQEVWRRDKVKVAWLRGREATTSVELPRDVPFDTLRLDITDWAPPAAGLCELEVYGVEDRTRNLALGRPCESNSVHSPADTKLNPQASFAPPRLTDGITRPVRWGEGYWLAADHQFAWVELRLGD